MTGYRLSDYLLRTVMAVKLAFLLILLLSTITQASAIATVSIGNLSSAYGETVTAPILISNVQNYGTGTISVTYDPSVVHVISVSSGPGSTVVARNADNATGIVTISAFTIEAEQFLIPFLISGHVFS